MITGTIQDQLEKFASIYPSKNISIEKDYVVCKVRRGMAYTAAKGANALIEQHGLDLTAIPTKLISGDSFAVQSSNTEH